MSSERSQWLQALVLATAWTITEKLLIKLWKSSVKSAERRRRRQQQQSSTNNHHHRDCNTWIAIDDMNMKLFMRARP